MQEKQVTIGDTTYPLEEPFLVLATQNPIEQEGTYPLPEAQVDRFMLKLRVGYPTRDEEQEILRRMAGGEPIDGRSTSRRRRRSSRRARRIAELYMDERIVDYIVDIVHATREPAEAGLKDLAPLIEFGASPRATIALAQASRAHAFLRGRGYVTPEDVKAIAPDVLRHRVLTTYEAEAEEVTSDEIVQSLSIRGTRHDRSEPECRRSAGSSRSVAESRPEQSTPSTKPIGVPPEILRQVKLIELRTRGLVNSLFTGEYRSVFKGQGMEFAEVREYQPGDDVRSIDWNVTARMRRPFVKRYIEERELTVMLAVDLSGSERFGTRRAVQERAGDRARRGARDVGDPEQRSRRRGAVHRSHRARRAAAQGAPARAAHHARPARVRAGRAGHRHRRRASSTSGKMLDAQGDHLRRLRLLRRTSSSVRSSCSRSGTTSSP